MMENNFQIPFVKLIRSQDIFELLKYLPAFGLMTQIALRAKRTDSISIHNLQIGEALIGDYKNIGLTQYVKDDDWRSTHIKRRKVEIAIRQKLKEFGITDEAEVTRIFELVSNQREY